MGFSLPRNDFELKYSPIYFESLCGVLLQLMLLTAFLVDPLKCFRNSAVYLVGNLALADLGCCVTNLLTIAEDPETRAMEFLDHTTIIASLLTILSIAADRYLLISHPFKHRLFMNNKKMVSWVALIWILSSAEGIKALIMNEESPSDDLVRHCFYILIALGTFFLYTATFRNLLKQSRSLGQLENNNSTEHRAQRIRILNEKRFLKTVVIIACFAIVTILPNAIFSQTIIILSRGNKEENSSGKILDISLYFIWTLNFVINPVLYFLRLPNYRKTFLVIYCCRKAQ